MSDARLYIDVVFQDSRRGSSDKKHLVFPLILQTVFFVLVALWSQKTADAKTIARPYSIGINSSPSALSAIALSPSLRYTVVSSGQSIFVRNNDRSVFTEPFNLPFAVGAIYTISEEKYLVTDLKNLRSVVFDLRNRNLTTPRSLSGTAALKIVAKDGVVLACDTRACTSYFEGGLLTHQLATGSRSESMSIADADHFVKFDNISRKAKLIDRLTDRVVAVRDFSACKGAFDWNVKAQLIVCYDGVSKFMFIDPQSGDVRSEIDAGIYVDKALVPVDIEEIRLSPDGKRLAVLFSPSPVSEKYEELIDCATGKEVVHFFTKRSGAKQFFTQSGGLIRFDQRGLVIEYPDSGRTTVMPAFSSNIMPSPTIATSWTPTWILAEKPFLVSAAANFRSLNKISASKMGDLMFWSLDQSIVFMRKSDNGFWYPDINIVNSADGKTLCYIGRGLLYDANFDGSKVLIRHGSGPDLLEYDVHSCQEPSKVYSYAGSFRVMDVATRAADTGIGHFTEDDAYIYLYDPIISKLLIMDAVTHKILWRLTLPVDVTPDTSHVASDKQGKQIAILTASNTVSFYSRRSYTFIRKIYLENAVGRTPEKIVFSDDGKRIIGISAGILQEWQTSDGSAVLTAASFWDQNWVAVTPEGFFDASPNGAKYLNLVRGLKAYSLNQAYQSLYRPDLVRAKLAGDPDGKVKAAAAKLDLSKVVESGPEPQVKFASTGGEALEKTQDVAVSVTDGGGGIGKVEWRVNGVTQGLEEGGVAKNTELDEDGDPKPSGKTIELRRTLQLEPGANKIEVVAYNAEGLIASDPVGITITRKVDQVTAPEVAAATTPRLFVLAVGVNDYFDGRLRLAYAVPDAKALADGFKQAGVGLYSEVSVTTLLNQDVTMGKLDATFAELGQKMKPTDVFVFFIAGHGKTVDGHYHFIPYDFRYQNALSILTDGIDQDHFQAWLARIPARKSLMLTDTCESGSLTEDPMRVASRGLEQVEAQNAAIELLTRAVGRTVLSASTDDAPALEGYRGHGVFSYAVLDALSHAQAGSDGFITVTSLAGFVDQRVQDVSYKAFHIRQIPQMKVVGSNFPVAHQLTTALVSEDGTADASAAKASDGAAIAAKPTHVVIAPVTVRATADASGTAVTDLAPGTQVTLVQTANGWTIVAREGKKLGYVKNDALARIQ